MRLFDQELFKVFSEMFFAVAFPSRAILMACVRCENCLKSTIPNMYADDTCVNIASENLNELLKDLKNELQNVSNWMRINKLSLNASKSEYMVIGHRRQLNKIGNDLPDLVLNNEIIQRIDKTKYLGIIIDESLNWKE